jgi:hypothetical protein
MFKLLEFLKSTGFGGFVGIAVACFLFFQFPIYFVGISILTVALIGAAIGGGCQQIIVKAVKLVLHPLTKNDDYYEKLEELIMLRQTKQISEGQYEYIVAKLTEKRFLGSPALPASKEDAPAKILLE